MKKIFLLSLCVYSFAFCDTESLKVSQVQEDFLQEILHNYPDLKTWYFDKASEDEKAELHDWAGRLVEGSINIIRKSDDEFIELLQEFEEITQLTNVKLITEIDVTLEPTDADCEVETDMVAHTKSPTEQSSELTQDITAQLSPVKAWYESATEGEKKQLDDLLAELFSYVNQVAANADEAKMRDLAGAIRILTGMSDLKFTLSVQMSIDQK